LLTESSAAPMRAGAERPTLSLSLIALCAAGYAVAIAATSPIPTPWGVGHFRPGVVVPAVFAVIFGPFIAGVGAGIGTFIGDLVLTGAGLTNPLLSLVAGVPGNFVGFYVLGWITSRYRSWRSFVWGSFVALFVGNLVAATGVVSYLSFFIPEWAAWPTGVKLATIMGFTFFWLTTMLPFVVPVVPVLVKALEPVSKRVSPAVRAPDLAWGKPSSLIWSSIPVAGVLVLLYSLVMFTPLGDEMFAKAVQAEYILWVKSLLAVAAAVMLAFGVLVSLALRQRKPQRGADPARKTPLLCVALFGT